MRDVGRIKQVFPPWVPPQIPPINNEIVATLACCSGCARPPEQWDETGVSEMERVARAQVGAHAAPTVSVGRADGGQGQGALWRGRGGVTGMKEGKVEVAFLS